jgi:CP family cyanate transporter-like MFS transporter
VGTLALLWFVGLYLRLPILVAPPLAPAMGAELDLNQAQIGALTTLPVLMLALGALPGSFVIARLGPAAAVVAALLGLALASAGRGLVPPLAMLFGCTAAMGFAIAIMQPALPVLVKRWCPESLALASAVYMNGLLMGEFIGAGLTLPLVMPLLGGDWRGTLVVWSLPALAVAGAVYLRAGRMSADLREELTPGMWNPRWREGRVWQLGTLLGAASAGFFGTNAYMGSVLEEQGRGDQLAAVLFYFNATQVAGSLLMLVLARVLAGRRWPVIMAACALPAGLLVAGLTSGTLFLAAVVLVGLCTCVQLILMVSLVPQITGEGEAGPLAAGMFAVGYLLGFLVPLGGGALADATGVARLTLLPLGVLAVIGAAVALAPGFGHGLRARGNQPRRR